MNNIDRISDYLNEENAENTTAPDSSLDIVETEKSTSIVSKEADEALDKKYSSGIESTETGDNQQYGLLKPYREIITGTLKND